MSQTTQAAPRAFHPDLCLANQPGGVLLRIDRENHSRCRVSRSVADVEAAIQEYLEHYDANPKPIVLTSSPTAILKSAGHGRRALGQYIGKAATLSGGWGPPHTDQMSRNSLSLEVRHLSVGLLQDAEIDGDSGPHGGDRRWTAVSLVGCRECIESKICRNVPVQHPDGGVRLCAQQAHRPNGAKRSLLLGGFDPQVPMAVAASVAPNQMPEWPGVIRPLRCRSGQTTSAGVPAPVWR